MGSGVDAAAAGIDVTHEVSHQAVGGSVVAPAGAVVGGYAQAARCAGIDAAAAGVDATHGIVHQAIGGGVVGEAEPVSQGGGGSDCNTDGCGRRGQQGAGKADRTALTYQRGIATAKIQTRHKNSSVTWGSLHPFTSFRGGDANTPL